MSTITTTIPQLPTQFQPIHYVPTSRKAFILSQRIHTIFLIAHAQFAPPLSSSSSTTTTTTTSQPTNHWSIYLVPPPVSSTSASSPSSLAPGPQPFIHIDCQPSHSEPSTVLRGGSKANAIISLLSSSIPTKAASDISSTDTDPEIAVSDAVHRVPLPVTRNDLTVGDIVDLLVREGREKYEFDESGVGCRFWVHGVVELLDSKGIVRAEDCDRAGEAVGTLWPEGRLSAMDRGAYY